MHRLERHCGNRLYHDTLIMCAGILRCSPLWVSVEYYRLWSPTFAAPDSGSSRPSSNDLAICVGAVGEYGSIAVAIATSKKELSVGALSLRCSVPFTVTPV